MAISNFLTWNALNRSDQIMKSNKYISPTATEWTNLDILQNIFQSTRSVNVLGKIVIARTLPPTYSEDEYKYLFEILMQQENYVTQSKYQPQY